MRKWIGLAASLTEMIEAQVPKEMAAIGFRWVETDYYLPQQHVLVLYKP